MLRFYDKGLTIYGTRHLSMDRISKPIDTDRIGRWRSELDEGELQDFYDIAADLMVDFGYVSQSELGRESG